MPRHEGGSELLHSQVLAFRRQIPIMYLILFLNSAIFVFNFYKSVPDSIALYFPAALMAVCVYRLVKWYRLKNSELTDTDARNVLQSTEIFAFGLPLAFIAWVLITLPYGDTVMRMHGLFYVAITTLACLLCLMHMRRAVIILALTIALPLTIILVTSGSRTEIFVVASFLLVAAMVVVILGSYYNNFVELIESKRELQEMHDRVATIACTDSLTGLANRRQFFTRLSELLGISKLTRKRLSIAILDLDGFKPVNDAYGHGTGDMVLLEVARRLTLATDGTSCVARLGGDEFGIILCGEHTDSQLHSFGLHICSVLRRPYLIHDIPLNISCSVGFASAPDAAECGEKLYECADYALYYAKRHARSTAVLFSEEHKVEIQQNSLIDQRLRSSATRDEIKLSYQPIVDTDTGQPISFEALARWTDSEIGTIAPDVFIQLAERNGHIGRLTEILLEKALMTAAQWPDHLHLSFNLSAYDITSYESAERITRIIAASDMAAGRVDLEVTETAIMVDLERACSTLSLLKQTGARILLDDFGSGYSSLSCVHQLPLDGIKIDRSFVSKIDTSAVSFDIVRTIIDMCASLDIDCVVEGIETEKQIAIMRDMNCRWMQGYMFAKPMGADKIADYLHYTKLQEQSHVPSNGPVQLRIVS